VADQKYVADLAINTHFVAVYQILVNLLVKISSARERTYLTHPMGLKLPSSFCLTTHPYRSSNQFQWAERCKSSEPGFFIVLPHIVLPMSGFHELEKQTFGRRFGRVGGRQQTRGDHGLTHQPERASVRFEPWTGTLRLIVLTGSFAVMKHYQREEETFGRTFRRGRETRADPGFHRFPRPCHDVMTGV